MARLLWLADVLSGAGLTVVEHVGFRTADGTIGSWKTHARPGDWSPRFGVVHATAAPRTQSDWDQVRIVRDGRSDLPGPIAVACVDRTGRWHVLSAGRCNTTLAGTAGPYEGLGNTYALGVEACNDNGLRTATYQPAAPEPWPPAQYRSYVVGWAAICRRLGWSAFRLVGHKEHTPGRKTDPTFDMAQFRTYVSAALAGAFPPVPSTQEDKMVIYLFHTTDGRRWRGNLVHRVPVPDGAVGYVADAGGVKVVDWTALHEGKPVADPDAFGVELTGATSTVGPTLDQIRAVVDEELDEQARGGADTD